MILRKENEVMSEFTGKYDFKDALDMHGYSLAEMQSNVEIYIGKSKEPLHINELKDLIPYYPYIIGIAAYDNVKRKSMTVLSSESFVDTEEREFIEFYLKQILHIYNRCRRKKIKFKVEDTVNEICQIGINYDVVIELANRVLKYGKKANIDDIHIESHEYYRRKLVDEMIKHGLDPADYGYGRFMEGNNGFDK